MLEGMSTSTDFNYGHSGGATSAPSQPISIHAPTGPTLSANPMHTAGAHSLNFEVSTALMEMGEALQTAIQEYVNKLSDDDKAAFQSAPNIIEHLQAMHLNGKSLISSSLTSRVEKVLQCVKNSLASLGIFVQHSSEITLLVVGGINCIFSVGTSSSIYLLSM